MTQILSLKETVVGASLDNPQLIKNLSGTTVYYRNKAAVSEGTNDGSLTENAEVTVSARTHLITASGSADVRITPAVYTEPGRRLVYTANAVLKESEAVGVYVPIASNGLLTKLTALKLTTGENSAALFYYDPANYLIAGKPNQLTLEVVVLTDNVAPTATFIGQLYKVEKTEAAEKKLELTYEAVTAVAPSIVTPAAKTISTSKVTFAAPVAGVYSPAVETITATTAAKSFQAITLAIYAT